MIKKITLPYATPNTKEWNVDKLKSPYFTRISLFFKVLYQIKENLLYQ